MILRHLRWCVVGAVSLGLAVSGAMASGTATWRSWGKTMDNWRFQPDETILSPETVGGLTVKWQATLTGNISATPAVEGNAVYVPDFGGRLTRLDRETGAIVWQRAFSTYTIPFPLRPGATATIPAIPGNQARATPAIAGNRLIIGDQGGRVGRGARVWAVDKNTGDPLWATTLSTHPAAVITQSASVLGNVVFVGVSSIEETFAAVVPGYVCCSFRGSMAALDARTGQILWQTQMIDDAAFAKGYRGNAVWGSAPVIDPSRGSIYIATGNNYEVPDSVSDCVEAVLETDPDDEDAVRACLAGDVNYFDTILALDIDTGAVKWANATLPFDAFTVACVLRPESPNCPSPSGPDHDFGQAPMLFRTTIDGVSREIVGAAQKSGVFWALNPVDGSVVWTTRFGPGGDLGGAMWGSATDGQRLYVTNGNHLKLPWRLLGSGSFAGQTTIHGFWSALDPATGAILWQTPDPSAGPRVTGPATVANGVMYAGTIAAPTPNNMFAFDAATGAILWGFPSGGSVNSGPAVADGVLFWGTGYATVGSGNVSSNKLFAFHLP